jgi:hypothetical protein
MKVNISKKIYVNKEVCDIRSIEGPIKFQEIKITIKDEDIVQAGYDDGFFSENNSWDPFYYFRVVRPTLETDEEHIVRIQKEANLKLITRSKRFKKYKDLQNEFESHEKKV